MPAFLVLLAGSFVFYLVAGIVDLGVITVAIVGNWMLQRLMKFPRLYLTLAVLLNLSLLGFLKYRGLFGIETFVGGSYADLVLPLGISFYTFQLEWNAWVGTSALWYIPRKRTFPIKIYRLCPEILTVPLNTGESG